MDFHHTYYQITGLAYSKGLDFFDDVMPRARVSKLFNARMETKGFKWMESNFISWIICLAGRSIRKNPALQIPTCKTVCKYRMPYETPGLQRNALRIEIFSPTDRCGWNIKPGRIGGNPDDYYPCTCY